MEFTINKQVLCYEIINQLYLGVIFMTAAVLLAAGVLCGKKQNVARW